MSTENNPIKISRENEVLDHVVIRFVGDSGDGMQLTGTQFSDTSAMFGNDVATFPNYPAEIRAPQGSLYGVSGFQVHIGSVDITSPGDSVDVLVAMNPAALKTNLDSLKKGQMLIVDTDEFNKKNFEKAHYDTNPLEDGSLTNYKVVQVAMTSLTRDALEVAAPELVKVASGRIRKAAAVEDTPDLRPLRESVDDDLVDDVVPDVLFR